MNWIERNLAPLGARLGEQRHLAAIRDGLLALTAFIIIGAFVTLLVNLPITGWGEFYAVKVFKFYSLPMWNGTMGILSVLACISIAAHLAQSYKLDGIIGGVMAASAFITITPELKDAWGLPFHMAGWLFTAIITAIITVEIWRWFVKNKIIIKMPDSVPPAVGKSFSAILPALGVLVSFALLRGGLRIALDLSVNDLILWVLSPLKVFGGSLLGALVAVLLVHLLWAVGVHGGTIVFTIFGPFFLEATTANTAALAAGQPIPNIITSPFLDSFVYIGGAGASLGLAICMLFRAKSEQMKALGKVAIGPALFNINEPILFGTPLIANPMLFIPFLAVPIVTTLTTYFAMASGVVSKTVAIAHWAAPLGLSAIVSTADWKAIILQVVNVAISVVVYYPFFVAYDKMKVREEAERAAQAGVKATA